MKSLSPNAETWLQRVPELEQNRLRPGMDPVKAEVLFSDILAAGESAVLSLIDSLNPVDDGKDWKARHLLHGLVTFASKPSQAEQRKTLEAIYSTQIQTERPSEVKTFIVMQLQWMATKDSCSALAEQLSSVDPQLIDAASRALVQIGSASVQCLMEQREKVDVHGRLAIDHAMKQIQKKTRS